MLQLAQAQRIPSGVYSGYKFQGDSIIRIPTNIISAERIGLYSSFISTSFQVFKNEVLLIDSLFDVTNMPKWGNYYDYWNYTNASQGALILPLQNHKLMFCSLLPLSLDPSDEYAKLYLCLYDTMSQTLLYKQKYMFRGLSEKMMAVRHSNGRDWWLFNKDILSFEYIKTLIINDNSLSYHTFKQKIGYSNTIGVGPDGQINFSQDGKILTCTNINPKGSLDVLDFNRHNGGLSNKRMVPSIYAFATYIA
ncbi:MAG: hypothetical protein IPO92_20305 [Saprospiraceae bacterium]|nr:hypothetical protein [Saprospiraceae bacterium]